MFANMPPGFQRACRLLPLVVLVAGALGGQAPAEAAPAPTTDPKLEQLRTQRRRFQDQELTTAQSMKFIFNPGEAPRIVWRDFETVQQLGGPTAVHIRWFDADLQEAPVPNHPGRWGAWIEGAAPNGTPVRRSLTFFARPPLFLFVPPPDLAAIAPLPGPIADQVWREHAEEIAKLGQDTLFHAFNDSEAGAILLAGLTEAKPLGRSATSLEWATVRNEDYNLALKLKLLHLPPRSPALRPPHPRPGPPAAVLHEGAMAAAGMTDDAAEKIGAVCRQWAEDSHEPFVTLVARHGVIVVHDAYGQDAQGRLIGKDYCCDVASITKSITGLMFAQFVDQGLVELDDSVGKVLPDYPNDASHVPTFRECLTHTSGWSGHGDWGGAANPHLENILLNGIDANEPGKAYSYSGMGFELTAKAMEILAGRGWHRLYAEQLFRPLGCGDVPLSNASAGAQCTARDLALIAQLVANRGSYGATEFFAPATFAQLLPEDLSRRYPGIHETEGIGMHWMPTVRPGGPADSHAPEDMILGPHVLGHGSLSSSMFMIDLDRDLIVVQARKQAGLRYADWAPKFFQAIRDAELP